MNKKPLFAFLLIILLLVGIYMFISIIAFDVVFTKIPGYDMYILPPYTAIKLIIYLFILSITCILAFNLFNKLK